MLNPEARGGLGEVSRDRALILFASLVAFVALRRLEGSRVMEVFDQVAAHALVEVGLNKFGNWWNSGQEAVDSVNERGESGGGTIYEAGSGYVGGV